MRSWGELHGSACTGWLEARHWNGHLLHITKIYYKQTQMVGITKGGLVHTVEPICTDFLSDTRSEGEMQERKKVTRWSFCLFVLQPERLRLTAAFCAAPVIRANGLKKRRLTDTHV